MEKQRLAELKQEDKKNNLKFQKGLSKIYRNKDGSLPDISHLEVKRKGRWQLILVSSLVIVILLSAISWLGFIIFNPTYRFSGQSIKLDLKGQQSIASGDEVIYVLEYKNIEKVTLKNVGFIFRYPEGFEFDSAAPEPANEFNTSWQIGDLAKNQEGKIEIKGRIIGEVGSLKTIDVTASFQPENFSSSFKETASFSSQVTSSILEIELDGPTQILIEKKATYKIKYRNASDQDLENIKVSVLYPTNFVFQAAEPAAFFREEDARNLNNQWLIETLEKNQEGEIEITGGYLADQDFPEVDFKVQIGFLEVETDEFSLQLEKGFKTQIVDPGLTLNLIINGSNQDQPINFGQTLTYSIIYKNLGQQELDDIEITAILDSDVLDWDTLEDKNLGVVEGKKIIWGKDQISEFDLVRSLDEGSINFSIQVKSADDIDLEEVNLRAENKATVTLAKIGELEAEDIEIESEEITNNINTDIQLKIEGRYFDDDNIAVGTGPLPPVVGQTTTFRIFWAIANSLHEVKNVAITTTLPNSVEWDDKYLVGAGDISYSVKDNTVTWSIDRISPNKTFDEVDVWFDISVTPAKNQVKKLLILTDQTILNATDNVTDSEITKIGKAVTSNLEDDPIGGGRGIVIDITE